MTLDGDLTWLVGEIAAGAHIVIAAGVTAHVLLFKRNIGTSISWMGIAWLSPFVGGFLKFVKARAALLLSPAAPGVAPARPRWRPWP